LNANALAFDVDAEFCEGILDSGQLAVDGMKDSVEFCGGDAQLFETGEDS
jgi:hypothetical protein